MSLSSWFPWRIARQHKGRSRPAHSPKPRRGTRLAVEQLEERTVLSTYPVANVGQLIAAIKTANSTPVADTIELRAGKTFTLKQVNNSTNGANGLPVIAAAGGPLTILGNGDTIERSMAAPAFRLFDVAPGASLTLANVTLERGLAYPYGGVAGGRSASGLGGAIFNQGTLTLIAATLWGNEARGWNGAPSGGYRPNPPARGAGGAIYSSGSLTLDAGTLIENNHAVGATGRQGGDGLGGGVYVAGGTATLTNVSLAGNTAWGGSVGTGTSGGNGGHGFGGAIYVSGGTVTMTGVSLSSNSAWGGDAPGGVAAGNAYGGALFAAAGTLTLRNDTVTGNSGHGGTGRARNGVAISGGLQFASAATVYLDTFTVSNTTGNNPNDIFGSYTLL